MKLKRQRIYIFGNWPYLFLIKIGISKNVLLRKQNVSKTGRGRAFVILSLSVPFARRVEQFLHILCKPLNIRWAGSGKTEWFFALAIVLALPILVLVALLEFVVLAVLFYGFYRYFFIK